MWIWSCSLGLPEGRAIALKLFAKVLMGDRDQELCALAQVFTMQIDGPIFSDYPVNIAA